AQARDPTQAVPPPQIRADDRLVRLAAIASVATAGVLIIAKLAAWFFTDSIAMLSSLVDSLLDIGASTLNLLAVHHARTPADSEHRFGHGKIEALAALAQAAFIAGSAFFLVFQAARRLITPTPLEHGAVGIWVMVGSIAATAALVLFQRHVMRHTNSMAIEADALHYVTDLLTNAAVILALWLSTEFGWLRADPIITALLAVYILVSAAQIARKALDMLMDRELPEDERERIIALVRAEPRVRDLHDLRTRRSGPQVFIQLHLELDGSMPLREAHTVATAVEESLRAAFPRADVLIHEDPQGIEEPRSGLPLV
ncbi:MAG: cation diffusion facilitator family transporter, partial [Myxococcales bacterium]|nr:cation diffusion facilitator family transporter [Myxococcales bacterium]